MYATERLTVLQKVVGLVGAEADLCVAVALQGAGVDVGRACQHVLVVYNHQLREHRVYVLDLLQSSEFLTKSGFFVRIRYKSI